MEFERTRGSGMLPFDRPEAPEIDLLVRRSDEDVLLFDEQRITDALIAEANVDPDRAREIAGEVRGIIERVGFRSLSSALVRELVNARLVEHGLEDAQRAHSRLGVPAHDVDRLLLGVDHRAESLTYGPEGTGMALAESVKREYGLQTVLSEPVSHAHLLGDIHIANLGAVDRPYALSTFPDFLKQTGVNLPGGFAAEPPARSGTELARHITLLTAALQGYLAGPAVWDGINYALAPYLEGATTEECRRIALVMLRDFSSTALARGGRPMPCDVHLDWDAPDYLRDRRAVGEGGELIDRTYGDCSDAAKAMCTALLEAFLEGDARGRAFASPRLVVHVTRRFAEQSDFRETIELATRAALERGNVTFAFDRGVGSSFFGRYGIADARAVERSETSAWRSSVLQSVALNLPRVAFLAAGDQIRVFEELTRLMEAASQAHLEKRVFLEKLLAQGDRGPLALLATRVGSKPFLRLAWTSHWIAPVGLAEMTRIVLGEEIQSSANAREFAGRVIGHLRREAERLSNKHKVRFVLSEASDPAAAHRFARLDVRFFGRSARGEVRGDGDGDAFYTAGLRLAGTASVGLAERLAIEGELHGFGIVGGGSDLWLTGDAISPREAASLVTLAFSSTESASVTFAPLLFECSDCGASARGAIVSCPRCASTRGSLRALVGDRFAPAQQLGAGRLAELGVLAPKPH